MSTQNSILRSLCKLSLNRTQDYMSYRDNYIIVTRNKNAGFAEKILFLNVRYTVFLCEKN